MKNFLLKLIFIQINLLFFKLYYVNGDFSISSSPYVVSISFNGTHYCGGTLISSEWVLTASHCLKDFKPISDLKVRIGSLWSTKGGNIYGVNETFIYDDPNVGSYFDDVGLIKLDKPAFGIGIIKLPEVGNYPADGTKLRVFGYGQTSEEDDENNRLMVVEIPVIAFDMCQFVYGKEYISKNMFCAYEFEKDACYGDGGGPAVIDDIQYGIISWGVGCGRKGYPGVYTQIANSWIRSWIYRISKI